MKKIALLLLASTHLTWAVEVIDLKTPQTFSGKRIEIEHFVGNIDITSHEDPTDNVSMAASGQDADKLSIEVRNDGEINIDLRPDVPRGQIHDINLTIKMPVKMPLELHLNQGKALIDKLQGKVEFYIDGQGAITANELSNQLISKIDGNGRIIINKIESPHSTQTMALSIMGSGDIVVDKLNHEDVTATIKGAGNIKLGGTVRNAKFNIDGNGNIEADSVANKLKQSIQGNGRIIVKDGRGQSQAQTAE